MSISAKPDFKRIVGVGLGFIRSRIHCKNRGFLACHAARPIFERMPGSIIERLKRKKNTPFSNITKYIYIYIYAVELLSGPSLGVSKVIIWAKSMLLSGPSLFSHYEIGVSGDFFCSVIILCFFFVSSYLLIF